MDLIDEPEKKETYLDIKNKTLASLRQSQAYNETTTELSTFKDTFTDTASVDTNSTIKDFKDKVDKY